MTQPGDELELVGTTLEGKYAVEAVVGEGGFATVYRATHTVLQRPVALKVFRALEGFSEADRRALAKGFVQEAAVLAELSERSAAILQARDVGMLATKRGEHLPYMVLEWLEGQTLEHVLEAELAEKLPLRTMDHAVRLLDPIGEALALAHSRGIAHRDVKPSNIFVLKGGLGVKLLDFGIAKIVEDTQQSVGAFAKTAGHLSSFTPAYGAPEQFSREYGATGPWTDVFALALVLVEMVTGKAALEGDSFVQLGMAAAHPKVRPTPRTRGATVSDAVEHVFAMALAVSPNDRWQSAGEMWTALSAAVGAERRSGLADHTVLVEIGSRSQAAQGALGAAASARPGAVASAKPAPVLPDLELPVPLPSAPRSRPAKAAPAAAYGGSALDWDDVGAADAPKASGSDLASAGALPSGASSDPSVPAQRVPPAAASSGRLELDVPDRVPRRPASGTAPGAERAAIAEDGGSADTLRGVGLTIAVISVGLVVAGGLGVGLHHPEGWRLARLLPSAVDGTSQATSGAMAALFVVLGIVVGAAALIRERRSHGLLVSALGLLVSAIAFMIVTASTTPAGEVGPPPEGAFLIPLALPLAPAGLALFAWGSGVRLWRDGGEVGKALALSALGGASLFAAVELFAGR
jgi:hypothetical protein